MAWSLKLCMGLGERVSVKHQKFIVLARTKWNRNRTRSNEGEWKRILKYDHKEVKWELNYSFMKYTFERATLTHTHIYINTYSVWSTVIWPIADAGIHIYTVYYSEIHFYFLVRWWLRMYRRCASRRHYCCCLFIYFSFLLSSLLCTIFSLHILHARTHTYTLQKGSMLILCIERHRLRAIIQRKVFQSVSIRMRGAWVRVSSRYRLKIIEMVNDFFFTKNNTHLRIALRVLQIYDKILMRMHMIKVTGKTKIIRPFCSFYSRSRTIMINFQWLFLHFQFH